MAASSISQFVVTTNTVRSISADVEIKQNICLFQNVENVITIVRLIEKRLCSAPQPIHLIRFHPKQLSHGQSALAHDTPTRLAQRDRR